MSVAYVDTSSLVAIAFDEPDGAEMAAALEGFETLVSSNLLEAELRSTFLREEVQDGAEDLLARLTWILPDRPLSEEMQRVARHGYLKGADLWHLACALFLAGEPQNLVFATLDRRQQAVARSLGFSLVSGMR